MQKMWLLACFCTYIQKLQILKLCKSGSTVLRRDVMPFFCVSHCTSQIWKLNFSTVLVFFWRDSPQWARASSLSRFLDHTQRRTTVGRTPLDEWSARRRDLYLTTHNTHNRQTSMPPVGFEPTIAASQRPQTYALDRAATGTGCAVLVLL